MVYRVWEHEEFKDFDEDEREDNAWKVPDQRGILYPEHSAPCNDARDAARQYATYFHNRRDGWECTWPLSFVVHDGERYWLVEVQREMVPDFSAAKPAPFVVLP